MRITSLTALALLCISVAAHADPINNSEGPPIPDGGIGFTAAIAYQW